MAVHIPALAEAIAVLVARGQVELFFGEPAGEMGLASSADVPNIVMDANNWWSPIERTTPETELVLTPETGLAPYRSASGAGHLQLGMPAGGHGSAAAVAAGGTFTVFVREALVVAAVRHAHRFQHER